MKSNFVWALGSFYSHLFACSSGPARCKNSIESSKRAAQRHRSFRFYTQVFSGNDKELCRRIVHASPTVGPTDHSGGNFTGCVASLVATWFGR